MAVDYGGHFLREVSAFEAAGRAAVGSATAPVVPSCPGWVMTDLVLHLGMVHRLVAHVVGERMQQLPEAGDRSWLGLADDWSGWLPSREPARGPVNPARPILHPRAACFRPRATTMDHRRCSNNIKGPSSWSGPELPLRRLREAGRTGRFAAKLAALPGPRRAIAAAMARGPRQLRTMASPRAAHILRTA